MERMEYQEKGMQLSTLFVLKSSDGIEVHPKMIDDNKLEWESGYPKTDDINRTCVAWSGYNSRLKIRNTKCDSSEDESSSTSKAYYDKELGEVFDKNLLQRGYLCETKAIHTITAYDRQVASYKQFNHFILLL